MTTNNINPNSPKKRSDSEVIGGWWRILKEGNQEVQTYSYKSNKY